MGPVWFVPSFGSVTGNKFSFGPVVVVSALSKDNFD